MPLEIYKRGRFWWVRGHVELHGRPITSYYRTSTGATEEGGARDWIAAETDRQRRRHLLGDEAALTFADAVMLYPFTPKTAKQLIPITEEIGDLPLSEITGQTLKELGPKLKPLAATDTWWREIVTPARAVINHAHEVRKTPYLRVKRYDKFERIKQDRRRGKESRVERRPGSREWIAAFCAAADPYNAALARFMFETAARIDQAVSLEPDDLDLMNKRVRVKAQKGHDATWVTISHEMMIELANLPPKQPKNRKTGELLEPRVFGYATNTGYRRRWRTICKQAGIEPLSAHEAGRHGFFTELHVRQGVDAVTAAKAGRWSDPTLPLRIYGHNEADESDIRARFRTNSVHDSKRKASNLMKEKGN
ncbi:phage integrase family protein [Paracoccus pantotrophus]|uniref:Phage integrase family protein n=2 Tax=Paracoccus pantotrophus TaxID=82367 RepID=A0ABX9SH89_PARPN|nr:tyrosine-type recombinase/integrase [Paracoccus pantotrophus]RKS52271.1 phage integrase family protein [Paracoccus pantotrophus]